MPALAQRAAAATRGGASNHDPVGSIVPTATFDSRSRPPPRTTADLAIRERASFPEPSIGRPRGPPRASLQDLQQAEMMGLPATVVLTARRLYKDIAAEVPSRPLAMSVLVGAVLASLAVIEGGQLRAGTWKGTIGTGTRNVRFLDRGEECGRRKDLLRLDRAEAAGRKLSPAGPIHSPAKRFHSPPVSRYALDTVYSFLCRLLPPVSRLILSACLPGADRRRF